MASTLGCRYAHVESGVTPPGTSVHPTPDLARTQFAVESRSYPLKPGAKYTLSLYMKSDQPRSVAVRLDGLGMIGKDQRGRNKPAPDSVALRTIAKLTTDWARYSVTGTLPDAAGGLYHVMLDYGSNDAAPGFD